MWANLDFYLTDVEQKLIVFFMIVCILEKVFVDFQDVKH